MFRLRIQVPQQRRDELLSEIADWPEVQTAQFLSPSSRRDELRRICFVELVAGADVEQVCKRLADLSDVEEVGTATPRRLL